MKLCAHSSISSACGAMPHGASPPNYQYYEHICWLEVTLPHPQMQYLLQLLENFLELCKRKSNFRGAPFYALW